MAQEVNNMQDILDSRDIIARIEELEAELEENTEPADGEDATEEQEELKALKELEEEASCSPDWQHGEALIRYSYFKEYAQELAEDCGMVNTNRDHASIWPNNCIDWDEAASQLEQDYMSVDFDGIEYWIRA